MALNLVTTDDGSWTLADPETGELFHNRAGAITEALKNYVEPADALSTIQRKKTLKVIDVCFGLGYNTWVLLEAILAGIAEPCKVYVLAIETNPYVLPLAGQMLEQPKLSLVREFFSQPGPYIPSFGRTEIGRGFLKLELNIDSRDLRQVIPELEQDFDLVFHDGFSPKRIPELWTVDLFQQYYRVLSAYQGRLLTYSSAVAVRAGLQQAGFQIYRTAPVGGKSGGTAAFVRAGQAVQGSIEPLTSQEMSRLNSRSGIPYRDPQFNASRASIVRMREAEQMSCLTKLL